MKRLGGIGIFLFTAAVIAGCGANPGRTASPGFLDDEVTFQRVQAAFSRAGPAFKDIRITVTNGVVTLGGTVDSRETRARAEQIAKQGAENPKLKDDLLVNR
jgi:BON domain